MQNSIALRLLWEVPDGSANQNVYPLIPLTHPPDLAHRHTQLCLMAIVKAEVAVFKWDNGWLRYTGPKWQPASMRCIPAKTRLPDDIFRGAGTRPVPVAVQLPKPPWWPPLAEYMYLNRSRRIIIGLYYFTWYSANIELSSPVLIDLDNVIYIPTSYFTTLWSGSQKFGFELWFTGRSRRTEPRHH